MSTGRLGTLPASMVAAGAGTVQQRRHRWRVLDFLRIKYLPERRQPRRHVPRWKCQK